MSHNNMLAGASILVLLLCIIPANVGSVVSYQIARVSVEPSTIEAHIGGNFAIDVNATEVDDLYSFALNLTYDTTVLDGLNIAIPSPWPNPIESIIDDQHGFVWINCSLTNPPGIIGNVTLASVTFEAAAGGTSPLDLHIIEFSNSTGSPITLIVNDASATVWPWNTHIPGDYPTIQEGINAADLGDIIFVSSDTYHEHVIVNKTVTLVGENRETTIIDGDGTGTVVTVTASNVKIEGFTVRNGGGSPSQGVLVWNSAEETISGNIIRNSYNGLELHGSNGNNIFGNIIEYNSNAAVYLSYSNNNTIIGNRIQNNYVGAWISLSETPNSLYHNDFISNTDQIEYSSPTKWDNGYEEGNYWSDYDGMDLDGDGIGDTNTPHLGVDYYPLMNSYIPGDTNHDGIVFWQDLLAVLLAYGSTEGDASWNPHADTNSDGMIFWQDLLIVLINYGKRL